ncbi:MAG: hypothetical protein E7547_00275 [Ruminococcaceae bacterium]|nr:hypothetical protein [Oscillospiraceae bacterium]
MFSGILSEAEFKKRLCKWLLDNLKGCVKQEDETLDDYAERYRLPDFDYVHTQSYADGNGDLITLLKSHVTLKDWETRNGRESKTFEFYLVLKTLTDSPEVEPFPMGYIIV